MTRHLRRIERMDTARFKHHNRWFSIWGLRRDLVKPGQAFRMRVGESVYLGTFGNLQKITTAEIVRAWKLG